MINKQTKLKVSDNSGVKLVKCFKIFFHRCGIIGSIVFLIIKDIKKNSKLKKGHLIKGIVIRKKNIFNRLNGNFITFDTNNVVLLNEKSELFGTRIFGPLLLELRKKQKIKLLSIGSKIV